MMILSKEQIIKSTKEWVSVYPTYEQMKLLVFGDVYLYNKNERYILWLSQFFVIKPGPKLGTTSVYYTRNVDLLPEEIKLFYKEYLLILNQ